MAPGCPRGRPDRKHGHRGPARGVVPARRPRRRSPSRPRPATPGSRVMSGSSTWAASTAPRTDPWHRYRSDQWRGRHLVRPAIPVRQGSQAGPFDHAQRDRPDDCVLLHRGAKPRHPLPGQGIRPQGRNHPAGHLVQAEPVRRDRRDTTGGNNCPGAVCRETYHMYSILPSSALRVEMSKHFYPYFGLNLSATGTPCGPDMALPERRQRQRLPRTGSPPASSKRR